MKQNPFFSHNSNILKNKKKINILNNQIIQPKNIIKYQPKLNKKNIDLMMENELNLLKEKLKNKNNEIIELKNLINKKEFNSNDNKKINKLLDIINTLEQKNKYLENKFEVNDQLEQTLLHTKHDLDIKENKINNTVKNHDELVINLNRHIAENNKLQEDTKNMSQIIDEIKNKNNLLEKQLSNFIETQKDNTRLSHIVEKMSKEIDELHIKLKNKDMELFNNMDDNNTLGLLKQDLEEKINKLKKDNKNLESFKNLTEKKIIKLEEENKYLNSELNKYTLTELDEEIKVKNLQKLVNEQENELIKSKKIIFSKNKKIADIENILEQYKSSNRNLKNKLNEYIIDKNQMNSMLKESLKEKKELTILLKSKLDNELDNESTDKNNDPSINNAKKLISKMDNLIQSFSEKEKCSNKNINNYLESILNETMNNN